MSAIATCGSEKLKMDGLRSIDAGLRSAIMALGEAQKADKLGKIGSDATSPGSDTIIKVIRAKDRTKLRSTDDTQTLLQTAAPQRERHTKKKAPINSERHVQKGSGWYRGELGTIGGPTVAVKEGREPRSS